MPSRFLACVVLLGTLVPIVSAQTPAQALLDRSIRYHDPDGRWPAFAQTLIFEESRPDGTIRRSEVTIDLPHDRFVHVSQDGETRIERVLAGDSCRVTLNGSPSFSEADAEEHRLGCDRARWIRDYYTYLWGLPMKLRDPGTHLDPEPERTTFAGREVDALRVTYDPDVGGDTWYFYLDPDTARLVGYRFYHDESKNDGEYIELTDEYPIDSLRLPQTRTWYFNNDDRLLGTDRLVNHRPVTKAE